jgi:cytochrome c-type biogenesis protein CcmH/NrfG
VALVKEGRLSGAEAAFRETLRINPGNSDARRNLADIRRLTGP